MSADQLTALIRSIPSGVNPYTFIEAAVLRQILPDGPTSFWTSVRINAVFLALAFALAAAGLVGKALQGPNAFWLFRLRRTNRGTLLLPNATVCFLVGVLYFTLMAQALDWMSESVYRNKHNSAAFLVINGFTWPGLLTATFSLSWGMSVAAFLNSDRQAESPGVPAIMLNVYFLLIPCAYWICVPTLLCIAGRAFEDVWVVCEQLASQLHGAAQAWDGRSPPALSVAMLRDLQAINIALEGDLRTKILRSNVALTVFTALDSASFVTSSIIYVVMLRRTIAQVAPAGRNEHLNYRSATHVLFARQLRRACAVLIVCTFALLCIGVSYIYVTARPLVSFDGVFRSGHGVEVQFMLPLYLFSFLGTPVVAVMTTKTYRDLIRQKRLRRKQPSESLVDLRPHLFEMSRKRSSPDWVKGIRIEQEVAVEVDSMEWDECEDDKAFEKLKVSTMTPSDAALFRAKATMAPYLVGFGFTW